MNTAQAPVTAMRNLLTTINKADIEETGIHFLTELHNEDFDEQKMVQLVNEIEKENAQFMETEPQVTDTAPEKVPGPVAVPPPTVLQE